MPADLARHVQEITDAVLENHIDPPARQQMILAGIKALYRAAGVPDPTGLGRRVSAVATPEQLAALLEEVWPKTTAKPVAVEDLEEALLRGPARRRARRYRADDGQGTQGRRADRGQPLRRHPRRPGHGRQGEAADDRTRSFEGGPADRAGVKKETCWRKIDGVDTKGMELRDVVERLRGDEGTDVTIKVRQPKETKSRTIKLTRGQLPRIDDRGRPQGRIGRLEPPPRRARSDRLPEDHRDHGQHAARAAQAGRADGERGHPGAGPRPPRAA